MRVTIVPITRRTTTLIVPWSELRRRQKASIKVKGRTASVVLFEQEQNLFNDLRQGITKRTRLFISHIHDFRMKCDPLLLQQGGKNTRWFISHYDFRMGVTPPQQQQQQQPRGSLHNLSALRPQVKRNFPRRKDLKTYLWAIFSSMVGVTP